MKRFFSLLLCLLLCLTLISAPEALAEEDIHSLNIAVTPPKAGEHPHYDFEFTPSGVIDMDFSEIEWCQAEPEVIPCMESSDTFVEGGVYELNLILVGIDGETWFADDMVVTVNGQPADGSCTYGSYNGVYTFPTVPKPISRAAVTITAPAIGASPDYSPSFPSGAKYDYDFVDWYDVTEGHYMNYGSDVFETGHQYRVYVYLYGLNGFGFTPDTTGTINGKAAACEMVNQELEMVYTFPKLTAVRKPVITTQPKNTTVYVGKKATFKVAATGSGLSYQWQYQKTGETAWKNVSVNGTSATYSLTTETRHNGYKYRCKVKNAGGTVTSSAATLKVSEKPVISTQPVSVSVNAGSTATFKVVADGATSYQWQYQKPGESTWRTVSVNGTSATYSLTAAARHSGYKYRCKVANAKGSVYSSVATLTVKGKPTITTQPKNTTVYVGKKATFKVAAAGSGLSYQWQYQKKGETTWNNVTVSGTSATYSLTTAARHNGYKYRCRVKNTEGTATSSTATLTVSEKPVIKTQPANASVNSGAAVTFKVVADGAASYQWQYQKKGETTWNTVTVNGKSAAYSLTAAARHNGYKYRCKVTNAKGSVYSSAATLTVK